MWLSRSDQEGLGPRLHHHVCYFRDRGNTPISESLYYRIYQSTFYVWSAKGSVSGYLPLDPQVYHGYNGIGHWHKGIGSCSRIYATSVVHNQQFSIKNTIYQKELLYYALFKKFNVRIFSKFLIVHALAWIFEPARVFQSGS